MAEMPLANSGHHEPEGSSSATQSTTTKPFKFKRKRDSGDQKSSGHRHHRSHRKRYKSARVVDDPAAYDDSASGLPPDVAFRESLFDALGDDEGAAFWEGVYGQPIHNYPTAYRDEATGELEQMNDDEYATYVRRKMWEKSWEGIEAAKEEKRRQDKHQRDKSKRDYDTSRPTGSSTGGHEFLFDFEIEKSLKRGEQRKERKRWSTLWTDYQRHWAKLQSLHDKWKADPTEIPQVSLREQIAWPVESGKRKDLSADAVENFVKKCAESDSGRRDDSSTLMTVLKAERIRFHPDKVQQRYGFMEIDEDTMHGVTAVFQMLDSFWTKVRPKSE